jgi:hypothetical protein
MAIRHRRGYLVADSTETIRREKRQLVSQELPTTPISPSFQPNLVRLVFIRGRIAAMDTHRHNTLGAILARIDKQIVESDTLLLKSLTDWERHRVTDELANLQIERLEVAVKLRRK